MINLSKNNPIRVQLNAFKDIFRIEPGKLVVLAGKTYEIRESGKGWYLRNTQGLNNYPFTLLEISPLDWCTAHNICPSDKGGIFPYMHKEDFAKALVYLKAELR